jgi:ElaA protein
MARDDVARDDVARDDMARDDVAGDGAARSGAAGGGAVRVAPTADLNAVTLYRLLQLRSAVFVVEQDCAYLDPDGRDLEDGALQLWIEADDGSIRSALRLLWDSPTVARLGRVATAPAHRRGGAAAVLVRAAVGLADESGATAIVLDSQSHLTGWYARLGFAIAGEPFLEDGIEHTPMRRG